jgi:guanylate kinase
MSVVKDQECMSNTRLLESYKDLMVYSTILNYIINRDKDNAKPDIDQSIVKKILRKCEEAASSVEGYIDIH